MRLAVYIGLMLAGINAMAQQPGTKNLPAPVYEQTAGDTAFTVLPVMDTAVLFTDGLFGFDRFSERRIITNGRDTAFYYVFSLRHLETVIFNIISPERDSITDAFTGHTIRQLYSGGYIHFLLGAGSDFTNGVYRAWLDRLTRHTGTAVTGGNRKKSRATFSKTALAEDTQFELYLGNTDDSHWLEAETIPAKKK